MYAVDQIKHYCCSTKPPQTSTNILIGSTTFTGLGYYFGISILKDAIQACQEGVIHCESEKISVCCDDKSTGIIFITIATGATVVAISTIAWKILSYYRKSKYTQIP